MLRRRRLADWLLERVAHRSTLSAIHRNMAIAGPSWRMYLRPTGVALPSGVTTAKIIQIDVFDSSTGGVVHDHLDPFEIAVQLSEAEKAICVTNPSQIALLHIDADNTVTRVPLLSPDCVTRASCAPASTAHPVTQSRASRTRHPLYFA